MLQEAAEKAKGSVTAQKRKAAAEVASKEANEYNWNELADTGKVMIPSLLK
jgi:ATP-dependent DNA helicase 2 subunit 1